MSASVRDRLQTAHNPTEKGTRKGWREIVERWTLRCPQCRQAWLAVGVKPNKQHRCKSCNHSFATKEHDEAHG